MTKGSFRGVSSVFTCVKCSLFGELLSRRGTTRATRHVHSSRTCFRDFPKAALTSDRAHIEARESWRKKELHNFITLLPDIVQNLTQDNKLYEYESANKWLAQVLQHNLQGGEKKRGLSLLQSYRILAAPEDVEPNNIRKAQIMGWCVEMLNTSLLMTVNALDKTGEELPDWYYEASGKNVYDPARIIETAMHKLLWETFSREPYYSNAQFLIHDTTHKAMMGHVLDRQTRGDHSLDLFTMNRYSAIVQYTASHPSFKLPVMLALNMAGIQDPEIHRQASTILKEMGQFYQVQKDNHNFESDNPAAEDDIANRKCSWLAVVALQRVTKAQREILQENYGSEDPEKIRTVKNLYHELGLPSVFKRYENHSYELLCTQIQQISRGIPHRVFLHFLDKWTHRD
nr:PREDICTED: farnesyl pyrophosphate synthase-like [Bemisia tabaci]